MTPEQAIKRYNAGQVMFFLAFLPAVFLAVPSWPVFITAAVVAVALIGAGAITVARASRLERRGVI